MADSINEDIEAAIADLVDEAGESVTVAGDAHDAFVEPLTLDEVVVAGGKAERGGFRVWVPIAVMGSAPAELAEVTVQGVTLNVLSVEKFTAHWVLQVGDPATTN